MFEEANIPGRLRVLFEDLRELTFVLRRHRKKIWNRVDPFAELLFDRMEKAAHLGYTDVAMHDSVLINGTVEIEKNVYICQHCTLDGSGGLRIGEGTTIAAGCRILTHDTIRRTLSGGVESAEYAPVVIEDCCFIGVGCTIIKGVTIGSHSIVGAGSVVTHSVPPWTIVAGVPAKAIGKVTLQNGKLRFIYTDRI